jgi:acetyl esterase/lipase
MLDGARAIQFLRSKAEEWGIDRDRIAASGGSAGAGISLWVGFHDDLLDPDSEDPVLRQSSRLSSMALIGAQTTYDPRVIATIVGGRAHEHPALLPFFGLTGEELDSAEAHERFEQASPDTYLSANDPPVFLLYNEPKGPLPPDAPPGQGIHHPNFGEYLGVKMDGLGIECDTRHLEDFGGDRDAAELEMIAFLLRQFGMEPSGGD